MNYHEKDISCKRMSYLYDIKRYGACEALILANLKFLILSLCQLSAENRLSEHFDGSKVWIFYTAKSMAKAIGCLSKDQVDRALKKLEKAGAIIRIMEYSEKIGKKYSKFCLSDEEFEIFKTQENFEDPYQQPDCPPDFSEGGEEILDIIDTGITQGQIAESLQPNSDIATTKSRNRDFYLINKTKENITTISKTKIPEKGAIEEFKNDLVIAPYLTLVSKGLQTIWLTWGSEKEVREELRDAICWLLSKPSRAKKNFGSFFNNWLKKARDEGKLVSGSFQKGVYHPEVLAEAENVFGPNVDLSHAKVVKWLNDAQKTFEKYNPSI